MSELLTYQNLRREMIDRKYICDSSEREELISSLKIYGDNIKFEQDIWNCDKKKKSEVHKNYVQIYFSCAPMKYRELCKYYAIINLNNNLSPGGVYNKIKYISKILEFLNRNNFELLKLNKAIEREFNKYLESAEEWSESYKSAIWSETREFLKFVRTWYDEYLPLSLFNKNPYDRDINNDYKYIPNSVVKQLDKLFENKDITRYLYIFYWIARSIPSRASEILGMDLDCIKPYGDDTWVLIIPTWKQNGGYKEKQLRRAYIHYNGHGKFLIDLIKEHRAYAESIQDKLPDELKGYLFIHQQEIFNWREFERSRNVTYYVYDNEFILPDRAKLRRDINKMCERFNIINEDGKIYNLTSHQLRHNGITNMIYSGFEPVQLKLITNHQGTGMITKSYTHIKNDVLIEKQKSVNGEKSSNEDSPILFKGKILNMDEALESRLLKNKRAYKLQNLGICSDVTGCQNGIFECLGCSHFVPDGDNLEYFKEMMLYWEERVRLFKNNLSLKENAEYNLELHKEVVKKIEKAIDRSDESEH